MVEIVPASIYLSNSQLVQGNNPIGQIEGTRHSTLALDPALAGHAFSVKTVASPLNDPTISFAPIISNFNLTSAVFSQAVTSLYEKQNNYTTGSGTGSNVNITG